MIVLAVYSAMFEKHSIHLVSSAPLHYNLGTLLGNIACTHTHKHTLSNCGNLLLYHHLQCSISQSYADVAASEDEWLKATMCANIHWNSFYGGHTHDLPHTLSCTHTHIILQNTYTCIHTYDYISQNGD